MIGEKMFRAKFCDRRYVAVPRDTERFREAGGRDLQKTCDVAGCEGRAIVLERTRGTPEANALWLGTPALYDSEKAAEERYRWTAQGAG